MARFMLAEQTNASGPASTSTTRFSDSRSFGGSASGTTGRSLTTESLPLPWTRRARTTTPALFSSRSGVSKKKTWRICASSGSNARARMVASWAPSGMVSLSSALSAPSSSWNTSASWSSFKRGLVFVGIGTVLSEQRRYPHS